MPAPNTEPLLIRPTPQLFENASFVPPPKFVLRCAQSTSSLSPLVSSRALFPPSPTFKTLSRFPPLPRPSITSISNAPQFSNPVEPQLFPTDLTNFPLPLSIPLSPPLFPSPPSFSIRSSRIHRLFHLPLFSSSSHFPTITSPLSFIVRRNRLTLFIFRFYISPLFAT
jgi:hypothetical protein